MARRRFRIALFLLIALGCANSSEARAIEPLVGSTGIGLGTILHPLQEPENMSIPKDFHLQCCCSKDRIHIFAVNGLNLLCTGNFNGLCAFLKKQGFVHTHFDQLYTCYDIADRVQGVRRKDPTARIVLIGFSLGCNSVRQVANSLRETTEPVDLLVYLGGDLIGDVQSSRPANVRRILNIRGRGLLLTGGDFTFNGADIEGARNAKLDYRHILLPSRRETLTLITEELLALMCRPTSTSFTSVSPKK